MTEKPVQPKKMKFVQYKTEVITMPYFKKGVRQRNENRDFLAIRLTKTYGLEPYERKWYLTDTQTEILTSKQLGMKQEATIKVVFRREGVSKTLKKIFKYFVVDCTVKFSKDNKHEFVTVQNGMFFYHNLAREKVAQLHLNSRIVKRGNPKEISEKEVARMFENKEISQVYDQNLRETCIYHVTTE